MLRAGVDGVNLFRADAINAPFALSPAGVQARPLLYGLILFARALGSRARLVTVRAHGPADARQLGTDGRWPGPPASQVVGSRGGTYTVDVRSASAALLSVRVLPGALGAATGARPQRAARKAPPDARSRPR